MDCIECGQKIGEDDEYCPKCGEPIMVVCFKCGQKIPEKDEYCPKCGEQQLELDNTIIMLMN